MNLLSVGAPTVVRAEYPELPGAMSEIAGIQKLFEGRDTVIEGARATPRDIMDAMPESFSMINFAAPLFARSATSFFTCSAVAKATRL